MTTGAAILVETIQHQVRRQQHCTDTPHNECSAFLRSCGLALETPLSLLRRIAASLSAKVCDLDGFLAWQSPQTYLQRIDVEHGARV